MKAKTRKTKMTKTKVKETKRKKRTAKPVEPGARVMMATSDNISGTSFSIGDRVTLIQPWDPCLPGDEGNVVNVDSQGMVTVRITHREGCSPFVTLLTDLTPDYLSKGGVCGT